MTFPGYRGFSSVLPTEDLSWSLPCLTAPSAFRRTLTGNFLPVLLSAAILLLWEAIFPMLFLDWDYRPIAEWMLDILEPS